MVLRALQTFSVKGLKRAYDKALQEALLDPKNTGVHVLLGQLENPVTTLRAGDITVVRAYLHSIGVTLHQRDARYVKSSQKFWSDPDKAEATRKSRQEGLQTYWEELPEHARLERGTASVSGKKRFKVTSSSTKEERAQRKRALQESTVRLLQGALEGKPKSRAFLRRVGGKPRMFESRWELSLYRLLRSLKIEFTYSNDPPGNWLWIGTKFWNPDFRIGNVLLEVKSGFLRASFNGEVLEPLKRSKIGRKVSVYVLDRDIHGESVASLKDLLKRYCTREHTPNRQ